jgi:pyruvate formate lyase activating enzyme
MEKEAMLYRSVGEEKVDCYLCHHHCKISNSKFGICGMRQNKDGRLYTHAYGEVIAANIDPIEKKPLYHFLPGTTSFSIATMGCNFQCGFCQNWQISQASKKKGTDLRSYRLTPADIVEKTKEHGCRSISYTYTEPTIFFEYAYDTAKLAKEKGLYNVFVTNGFMTHEALDMISPYLDACNVDLKSFRKGFYKKTCHARLEPVLDSVRWMKKLGMWVEITTLIVPGVNDEASELASIARFIAGLDRNIPWHISRFHPDYKFTDTMSTPIETLRNAYAAGKNEGLRYVYVGNVAGESGDILCPKCRNRLVHRRGFLVVESKMSDSQCSYCGEPIAGFFLKPALGKEKEVMSSNPRSGGRTAQKPDTLSISSRKETAMDVKSYCDTAQIELNGWKAKIYDVIRKTDKLSTGEKEKVVPMIQDLHIVVEELAERIDKLNKECPTEWNPQKKDIEGRMSQLRDNWKALWGQIAPGDIGG